MSSFAIKKTEDAVDTKGASTNYVTLNGEGCQWFFKAA